MLILFFYLVLICEDVYGVKTDDVDGTVYSPCKPPCGLNTHCKGRQSLCQGFVCFKFECIDPCIDHSCGSGAECTVENHEPICTCPSGYGGDPTISCTAATTVSSTCKPPCGLNTRCKGRQSFCQGFVCFKFECIDPCIDHSCGSGAECTVENHAPICTCFKGYVGDPTISCTVATIGNLCEATTCGINANCALGKDNSGHSIPVCTCPLTYIGNPTVTCQKGICLDHNQCPDNLVCESYICKNPCYSSIGTVCGKNALCSITNHQPNCYCPSSYKGNPWHECTYNKLQDQIIAALDTNPDLPAGFQYVNGRYVFGNTSQLNRFEAIKFCENRNAVTFRPFNAEDYIFMEKFRLTTDKKRLWFPINDVLSEGNFVWTDGEPITKEQEEQIPWSRSRPYKDNSAGDDCGLMAFNGKVYIERCNWRLPGVLCSL